MSGIVSGKRFAEQMRKMLPQWMKIAKDPNSVGAQFLTVFGMEFEDIQNYLDMVLSNQYIDSADIGQIDITYKVPLALPVVTDIIDIDTIIGYKNDEPHTFLNVKTLRKFYMAEAGESVCILDRTQGVVYLRPSLGFMEDNSINEPLDYVSINGTNHYEYSLHHVWNAFDEFGLILGVERLYAERNDAFKQRILDVFRKPANSTRDGLKNGLSRELGLTVDEVVVNEFANPAFRESLLNSDGTPSQKLINYVDQVNKVLGFTWDNMSWGEAYWRSIEENNLGLEYLPHVWDASTVAWKDEDFESGIGDGNDLLVTAPTEQSNERNYKFFVGLRGIKSGAELIDPEIGFKYKVVAKGSILNEEYKEELYKYTVIAAEAVRLNFIVKAFKEYWKTTKIDFNPATVGYVPDNNAGVEIVKGTTIMSNSDSESVKLLVEMKTRSVKDTPSIDKLHVKWKDTVGGSHTFTLDSQVDFTRNDATVDTNMTGIFIPTSGGIELGFGDFYYKIDTEGSWREGAATNVVLTPAGSAQLKLPR